MNVRYDERSWRNLAQREMAGREERAELSRPRNRGVRWIWAQTRNNNKTQKLGPRLEVCSYALCTTVCTDRKPSECGDAARGRAGLTGCCLDAAGDETVL